MTNNNSKIITNYFDRTLNIIAVILVLTYCHFNSNIEQESNNIDRKTSSFDPNDRFNLRGKYLNNNLCYCIILQ